MQHAGSRCYVFLLFYGSHGSAVSKISLVEEVPDRFSDGSIRVRRFAQLATVFHRVRLPESLLLGFSDTDDHLLHTFQKLSYRGVHKECQSFD